MLPCQENKVLQDICLNCIEQCHDDQKKVCFQRYNDYLLTEDQPITSKDDIARCFSSQKTPKYYGQSIYRIWCHFGGNKDDYYDWMRILGFVDIANRYQKKKEKQRKKKKPAPKQRSNNRKILQRKLKKPAKVSTDFTDVKKEGFNKFIKSYKKLKHSSNPKVSPSPSALKKNLNKCSQEDGVSLLSNAFTILLVISYWMKYISKLRENKISTATICKYGPLLIDNFSSKPVINEQTEYLLIKQYQNNPEMYRIDEHWIELFDEHWIEFEPNHIHKSIMDKIEELDVEEEDVEEEDIEEEDIEEEDIEEEDIEEEDIEEEDIEEEVVEEEDNLDDIQSDDVDDINDENLSESSIDNELYIAFKSSKCTLTKFAKKELKIRPITFEECLEITEDDLNEYLNKHLNFTIFERKRLISYIKNKK